MRAPLALAALLALAPLAAGGHAPVIVVEGSILVGHLGTVFLGGVTESLASCDPSSPLNGLDGVWVDIRGYVGHPFLLTTDPTLDGDLWFYTDACLWIHLATGAHFGLGEPEHGRVPDRSAYLIVDGGLGTGAFRLTVG